MDIGALIRRKQQELQNLEDQLWYTHLTTKQLWAQGAVASYGVVIEKIPQAVNIADAFTHFLSGQVLMDHLRRLGFR